MTEQQIQALSLFLTDEQFKFLSCPSEELRHVYERHQVRQLATLLLSSPEFKAFIRVYLYLAHLKKHGGSFWHPFETKLSGDGKPLE